MNEYELSSLLYDVDREELIITDLERYTGKYLAGVCDA